MNILAIMGSPRKNGNTATTLGWLKEELASQGNEIELININEVNVNPCAGCLECKKHPDKPGCVQTDDGNNVYQKMIDSDGIIISSPLYMWSFSAQIKALLDRGICVVSNYKTPSHTSLLSGKKCAVLLTCAGPEQNNADLIQTQFSRWAGLTEVKSNGLFTVIPMCSVPSNLSTAAREQCGLLADKIGA